MIPNGNAPFVACAMYAFDDATKAAWTELFAPLADFLDTGAHRSGSISVRFSDNDANFESARMIVGHTCGLPFIKRYHSSHVPVSVPGFDIPGCNGPLYRSWFICQASDQRDDLSQFEGSRVAINGHDSNSGMNVLRYEVARLARGEPGSSFFETVEVTGGHANSMRCVASGRADLAAIDAVSYHHLVRLDPHLGRSVRIFGQSGETTGLPFVVPLDHPWETGEIAARQVTRALNQCLEQLSVANRRLLAINQFCQINTSDFESVRLLDEFAVARGYEKLT